MPASHRILVVDDDELFLEIVRHNLENCGYDVTVVADPREGVNLAIETHFDLILLDLMMPGMRGEEVLSLLKPLSAHQRILVVSGHTGSVYRSRARDLGAVGYLEKPLGAEDLKRTVQDILSLDVSEDFGADIAASKHILDRPVRLVFGEGVATPAKRLVALLVLLGFAGIVGWLAVY